MTRAALAELDRLTRSDPDPDSGRTGRWIGVEHEFRVLGTSDQLDFRTIIPTIALGRPGLDPGDPRARRLRSGAMLTADGREAEIASPPVPLGPGFSTDLVGHLDRARTDLCSTLGRLRLDGYSTHISVEVPERHVVRTARRFVASCSPTMMLLMDRADSPGLLVRPRRGRLELCGEHVTGDSLRAATVFASAATARLLGGRPGRALRLRPVLEPARERFGWYVDRRAFGPDLYTRGRAARLGGRGGGPGPTAQEHLERSWNWCRDSAVDFASADEVALVDRVVSGDLPLPLETLRPGPVGHGAVVTARADTVPVDPFGAVLHERRRGNVVVTAGLVTWSFVVLDVTDERSGTVLHLGVPGTRLARTLAALDAGALDSALQLLLAHRDRLPVLASTDQTGSVGAYRSVGRVEDLVPGERDPLTGRIGGPRGPGSRRSKDRSESSSPNAPAAGPPRKLLGAAAAVTAVVVIGGGVALAMRGGGDERTEGRDPGDDSGLLALDPGGDPSGGFLADPTGPGEAEAVLRPLTKDACTLLDASSIAAFEEAVNGDDYTIVGSPVTRAVTMPAGFDPALTRQCEHEFQIADASIGATASGTVWVELLRLRPDRVADLGDTLCHTDDGGTGGYEPLSGIGDSASASFGDGRVCVGDVQISISHSGVSTSDPPNGPVPELRALLEAAAADIGDG